MPTNVHRTAGSNFADVAFHTAHPVRVLDWHAPDIDGPLALHVVDAPAVGSERGTFLLLHGEPSWSVLYEEWIPRLTARGYRCVAPDQPGFGRSDKPTDDDWYSYERHVAAVRHVIDALDLRDINLVVQDWAGPIGLRQAVDQPQRFANLFIFNTWLHHDGYEYGDGVRWWRQAALDPEQLGGDMPTGRIVAGSMRRDHHDRAVVAAVFDAPFDGYDSKAGARAFPGMIPFGKPDVGGALQQQRCHEALLAWTHCPVHVAFGDADMVFPFEKGEAWAASIPGATIDRIEQAGHFVQYDAPADCLRIIETHLGLD
jgi:haloalkane dehalogenase